MSSLENGKNEIIDCDTIQMTMIQKDIAERKMNSQHKESKPVIICL